MRMFIPGHELGRSFRHDASAVQDENAAFDVLRRPRREITERAVDGNRPDDNNFYIDGADDNDVYYGTTVINAEGGEPLELVQELLLFSLHLLPLLPLS